MVANGIVCRTESEFRLTLRELSNRCGVSAEKILLLIDEGVLDTDPVEGPGLLFGMRQLVTARRALRLESDLGINPAGIALVLPLLEESQRLRDRVAILEALLFEE